MSDTSATLAIAPVLKQYPIQTPAREESKIMALIRSSLHEMEALPRDIYRMFETLASSARSSMKQSFMSLAEMEQIENAVQLRISDCIHIKRSL